MQTVQTRQVDRRLIELSSIKFIIFVFTYNDIFNDRVVVIMFRLYIVAIPRLIFAWIRFKEEAMEFTVPIESSLDGCFANSSKAN